MYMVFKIKPSRGPSCYNKWFGEQENSMRITRGFFILITMLLIGTLPCIAQESHDYIDWTSEQLSDAFDEVARNYGAVEYATFTFMVEFNRIPEDIDELRDTGHLNVRMTNPYTGGPVVALYPSDIPDGALIGNFQISTHEEGSEVWVDAWYLRRDSQGDMFSRSMQKRIALYSSSVDYEYFFENDLTREEQFVAVYCRHAIDAIESFQQRNGRSPDHFIDMYDNGDVNTRYINPITDSLATSTEDLSPGDFLYRKIGEDGYTLIGWGLEEPVFFATTDEIEEMHFYVEWAEVIEVEGDAEQVDVTTEDDGGTDNGVQDRDTAL